MKTMRKMFTIPILGTKLYVVGKESSALIFEPSLYGRLIRGEKSPIINGKRELSLGRLSKREMALQHEDGVLLSERVVTNAGVTFLRDDWNNNGKDITNMTVHANGTGALAEAVGDTALGAETGTRVAGVKTVPAFNQLQTVATIAQDATRAITEHGIFDSTTVLGSTLWDRSVFAAINVVAGDSVQYTMTVTINSGG